MTHANNLATEPQKSISLPLRMLAGAMLGLAIILFFILPVRHPNPEWGNYWMVRPLIITPLAGAMAGAFSYFMLYLHKAYNWNKTISIIFSALALVIGLWMGIVLGLVDTLWH